MRWWMVFWGGCWLVLALGCGDGGTLVVDSSDVAGGDSSGELAVVPNPWSGAGVACVGADRLEILQVRPWPGGGGQWVALLRDGVSGAPVSEMASGQGAPWEAVALAAADGSAITVAAQRVDAGGALGVIILQPSLDPALHAARQAMALALLDALPAEERWALWVAGAQVEQVVDLAWDRGALRGAVAAVPPQRSVMAPEQAFALLYKVVRDVEGPYGALWRTLVWVGEGEGEVLESGGDHEPIQRWVLRRGEGDVNWPRREVAYEAGEEVAAAQALVQALAAERAATFRVGWCAPAQVKSLLVALGGSQCAVETPIPLGHLAGAACDAAAAAADSYPYPRTLAFEMRGEERVVYDQRVAARDKTPFRLRVRLGEGDALDAEVNLRGQSSLGCARKSYSVNLAGSLPRRLTAALATDRFYLLSLCEDRFYFHQHLAMHLLRSEGVFPLPVAYVNLLVDGVDQGVYLLTAQPKSWLVQGHLHLGGLVRRRFDPEYKAEDVLFPSSEAGAAAVLASYWELNRLATDGDPSTLAPALLARMDYRAYLRWMAFNS